MALFFSTTPIEQKSEWVCGSASWYALTSKTASGERMDPNKMTTAHKTLPFGTKLEVKYGDKTVIVRVNDRGPFAKGRKLDLSKKAAKELGFLSKGVAKVCYREI